MVVISAEEGRGSVCQDGLRRKGLWLRADWVAPESRGRVRSDAIWEEGGAASTQDVEFRGSDGSGMTVGQGLHGTCASGVEIGGRDGVLMLRASARRPSCRY